MRRFVTAGSLALIVALFAGCSEQAKESPTEPQFGKKNKVTYDCPEAIQKQKEALDDAIDLILLNVKSRKGAHSNVDNMARNICLNNDHEAALVTYSKFEIEINQQNVNKLEGGEAGREALLALAYGFASGAPYNPGFEIPPEALGDDGFVEVISPGDILPGDFVDLVGEDPVEGALRVPYGAFPADAGDVILIGYRMLDETPDFGDTDAYPEIWFFDASVAPIPIEDEGAGVERWVCVVEPDYLPVPFEQLVIGRSLGGGAVELLEPPLYDNSPLDCTQAASQLAFGPESPAWLKLAGMVLEPVISRVLGVKPAYAMYFKGTGLGGRGGSFSPNAPVDRESATIPDPVIVFDYMDLDVLVGTTLLDYYYFTVTNWADYPDFLFYEQSEGACPSRTHLDIFDAGDDGRIYGFCAFDSPDDLQSFWFVEPAGTAPPAQIYIELADQATEAVYTSNAVGIPVTVGYTLNLSVTGAGRVDVPGQDLSCASSAGETTNCSYSFTRLLPTLTLTPVSDIGFDWPTWTGCDPQSDNTCDVATEATMNVSATFSLIGPS